MMSSGWDKTAEGRVSLEQNGREADGDDGGEEEVDGGMDLQGRDEALGVPLLLPPRSPGQAGRVTEQQRNNAVKVAKSVAAQVRSSDPDLAVKQQTSHENPRFLNSFYKASRLHFIGTWKRLVIHVDMDCFFCSVSCLGRKEMDNMPVAITWGDSTKKSSNAEISSANYKAREYGLKAGMWLDKARTLCPDLITLPYEFEKYSEAAERMYRELFALTPHVEGVSCDEAFADVTGLGTPQEVMSGIRARIKQATGCNASVGCSVNRLLARMATAKAKPDGQFYLCKSDVDNFFQGLGVRTLPGVGRQTYNKLEAMGVSSLMELRGKTKIQLQQHLGQKTGTLLYEMARGIDSRPWEPRPPRKSVCAQATWGVRFKQEPQVEKFVGDLAEQVAQRLREAHVRGRSVQVEMMRAVINAEQGHRKGTMGHGICDKMSRSVTLPSFTADAQDIKRAAIDLVKQLQIPPDDIRGIGIQVTKLDSMSSSSSASTSNKLSASAPPPSIYKPGTGRVHYAVPTSPPGRAEGGGAYVNKSDLTQQGTTRRGGAQQRAALPKGLAQGAHAGTTQQQGLATPTQGVASQAVLGASQLGGQGGAVALGKRVVRERYGDEEEDDDDDDDEGMHEDDGQEEDYEVFREESPLKRPAVRPSFQGQQGEGGIQGGGKVMSGDAVLASSSSASTSAPAAKAAAAAAGGVVAVPSPSAHTRKQHAELPPSSSSSSSSARPSVERICRQIDASLDNAWRRRLTGGGSDLDTCEAESVLENGLRRLWRVGEREGVRRVLGHSMAIVVSAAVGGGCGVAWGDAVQRVLGRLRESGEAVRGRGKQDCRDDMGTGAERPWT